MVLIVSIGGFAQQRNCCGRQDEDLVSTTSADRTLESMACLYHGTTVSEENVSQRLSGQISYTSAVHRQAVKTYGVDEGWDRSKGQ